MAHWFFPSLKWISSCNFAWQKSWDYGFLFSHRMAHLSRDSDQKGAFFKKLIVRYSVVTSNLQSNSFLNDSQLLKKKTPVSSHLLDSPPPQKKRFLPAWMFHWVLSVNHFLWRWWCKYRSKHLGIFRPFKETCWNSVKSHLILHPDGALKKQQLLLVLPENIIMRTDYRFCSAHHQHCRDLSF